METFVGGPYDHLNHNLETHIMLYYGPLILGISHISLFFLKDHRPGRRLESVLEHLVLPGLRKASKKSSAKRIYLYMNICVYTYEYMYMCVYLYNIYKIQILMYT